MSLDLPRNWPVSGTDNSGWVILSSGRLAKVNWRKGVATRSLSCCGFGPLTFVPLEEEDDDDEEEEEEDLEVEDDDLEDVAFVEEEDDDAPPAPFDPTTDDSIERK